MGPCNKCGKFDCICPREDRRREEKLKPKRPEKSIKVIDAEELVKRDPTLTLKQVVTVAHLLGYRVEFKFGAKEPSVPPSPEP